ncbi:MAG: hypothetical protein AAFZ09_15870 [Pseudomonadota bacterium]
MIARTLIVLLAVLYAVMAYLVLWRIMGMTGLSIFDIKTFGYSPDYARSFLSALPPEGVQLYFYWMRPTDTAVLTMLAATIIAYGVQMGGRLGLLTVPSALGTAILDVVENIRVSALISGAEPATNDAFIQATSRVTQVKYGLLVVSLSLLVFLARRQRHD